MQVCSRIGEVKLKNRMDYEFLYELYAMRVSNKVIGKGLGGRGVGVTQNHDIQKKLPSVQETSMSAIFLVLC